MTPRGFSNRWPGRWKKDGCPNPGALVTSCTLLPMVAALWLGVLSLGGSLVASDDESFERVFSSGLLRKVVGMSDGIPLTETPGGNHILIRMEPLKPYFVLGKVGDYLRVADRQGRGRVEGFVEKSKVADWNTREGLHFVRSIFLLDRRATISAWESEEKIRKYAMSGDFEVNGPAYQEDLLTRVGKEGLIPYPLLDTKEIETKSGDTKIIHNVLIPAIVEGGVVETDLSPDEVEAVAGAVTICVIFDATGSMGPYASELADTIDRVLSGLNNEITLAAAGFVLFRDLGPKAKRFEVANPMPLDEASDFLRKRVSKMKGGDDPAEPVLDAAILAHNSFLWNGGSAIRGAKRIAIVVLNTNAKTETIGLSKKVPKGLGAEEVAETLARNGITVFALQAGPEDQGDLRTVLETLARETGGDFYPYEYGRDVISESFSANFEALVSKPITEGSAVAKRLRSEMAPVKETQGTVIPLSVLDDEVMNRLRSIAKEFNVAGGGLLIRQGWVFEQTDLYREMILIEKPVLEWMVRFFNVMTDSSLDGNNLRRSMVTLLEALAGEDLEEGMEVQELLEKRLGIHFSTNLLSFEVEFLAVLNPKERLLMQERIRRATGRLADFLELKTREFSKQPRIWMPVSYLP